MKDLQQTRACERNDLWAIVPRVTYWEVTENGDTGDFADDGQYDPIEQYVCNNCGKDWMPETPRDEPGHETELQACWQEALEHLKVEAT